MNTKASQMTFPSVPQEKIAAPQPGMIKAALSLILRTLILFLVLEIVLRLFGVDPRQAIVNPEGPYIRDEKLHWALKPNYSKKWGGAQVDINDKGLRDEPLAYEKPAGVNRILVLGGSVTFAYGVDVQDGYVSQVEKLLNESGQLDHKVQTINTGVGGYSTFQELGFLQSEGYKYSPDIVVLTFGLNDFIERYLIVKKYGGTGQYRGGRMTEIDLEAPKNHWESATRFVRDLPKKTALFSLARYVKVRLVARKMGQKEVKDQVWMSEKLLAGEYNEKLHEAIDQTFGELREWLKMTRGMHALPVLLVFPDRLQVEKGLKDSIPQKLLADFAKQEGISIIDLTPTYVGESATKVFLDEDHPSAYGHKLAAEAITKAMLGGALRKTSPVPSNPI